MRHNRLAFVAVAASVGLIATACGGDDGGGEEAGGGGETGAPALEAPDPSRTSRARTPPVVLSRRSSTSGTLSTRTRRPLSSSCRIADQQRAQMIQNAETSPTRTRSASTTYGPPSSRRTGTSWSCRRTSSQWTRCWSRSSTPRGISTSSTPFPAPPMAGCCTTGPTCSRPAGIAEPPGTWQEMIDQCEQINATPKVRASLATRANSRSTRASPSTPPRRSTALAAWSPTRGQAERQHARGRRSLNFLVNGFTEGYIPAEAITYKEEEGRRAFMEGSSSSTASGPTSTPWPTPPTARPRLPASSMWRRCQASTVPAPLASAVTRRRSRPTLRTRRALSSSSSSYQQGAEPGELRAGVPDADLHVDLRRPGAD